MYLRLQHGIRFSCLSHPLPVFYHRLFSRTLQRFRPFMRIWGPITLKWRFQGSGRNVRKWTGFRSGNPGSEILSFGASHELTVIADIYPRHWAIEFESFLVFRNQILQQRRRCSAKSYWEIFMLCKLTRIVNRSSTYFQRVEKFHNWLCSRFKEKQWPQT